MSTRSDKHRIILAVAILFGAVTTCIAGGTLRVHPDNPRYFTDDTGHAVYLTGSHTWLDLQDGTLDSRRLEFDYGRFLEFLERHHHNFFRLWAWESPHWVLPDSRHVTLGPLPFARTGPGKATDGGPKFDLTKFNPGYFERLRQRVEAAQQKHIYVGVMLFQGFSVARKSKRRKESPWLTHPFNGANNINGIDGDLNGDGEGYEVHTLAQPRITRVQEAYVRRVIDTVGDLDNVIYEISNESHGASAQWQYHMIDLIHRYEKTRPKQHPVWMSYTWDGLAGPGRNVDLFKSPAEAISPHGADSPAHQDKRNYKDDPPVADGSKVIIADTDHLWGIGGSADWVWKSFTRGLNPIFMDPYCNSPHDPKAKPDPKWEPVRRAMGQTRDYARRMDLVHMTPSDDPKVCSTRYCLRNPGKEYLAYQPNSGPISLQLEAGQYRFEWFDPGKQTVVAAGSLRCRGGTRTFTSPVHGAVVLYVACAVGEW